MLKRVLIFLLLGAVTAGCTNMGDTLPDDKKREIYQQVRDEVNDNLQQGELYEQRGELRAAVDAYRKACSLDPNQTAAKAKADRLEKQIDRLSDEQLRKGLRELHRNHRLALRSFSRALRINPANAKAAEHSDLLLKEHHIAAEVEKLQHELARAAETYGHKTDEIVPVERRVEALLALDARNTAALAVRAELDKDRRRLGLVPRTEAKRPEERKAAAAAPVAPAGPASAEARPAAEQRAADAARPAADFAPLAAQVREHIAAGDCAGALAPWQQLQAAQEPQAVQLVAELEGGMRPALLPVVDRGRRLFDQKKFDDSLPLFQCVLQLDPGNDIARIYSRKIKSRLRTIEELE